MTQVFFVVVHLDGTCPSSLPASVPKQSLLACLLKCWKDLDPNNLKEKNSSFFVLGPGLNIPWVTKRSGLQRAPLIIILFSN
jgi:hypothetical protein